MLCVRFLTLSAGKMSIIYFVFILFPVRVVLVDVSCVLSVHVKCVCAIYGGDWMYARAFFVCSSVEVCRG